MPSQYHVKMGTFYLKAKESGVLGLTLFCFIGTFFYSLLLVFRNLHEVNTQMSIMIMISILVCGIASNSCLHVCGMLGHLSVRVINHMTDNRFARQCL